MPAAPADSTSPVGSDFQVVRAGESKPGVGRAPKPAYRTSSSTPEGRMSLSPRPLKGSYMVKRPPSPQEEPVTTGPIVVEQGETTQVLQARLERHTEVIKIITARCEEAESKAVHHEKAC